MREFRRSLPMSLLRAREAVMKKFMPHLREHDLSAQQWRVLRALYDADSELEMNEVAERCYLLMPSLSRIVQNLVARKLMSRRTSDTDQRRTLLRISEAGKALVKVMAPQSERRYEHIQEVFGYGKLELLYELLDELTEKLQDPQERDSRDQ